MSKFNALVLNRDDDENLSHAVEQLDESELPAEGEVLIAVEYSTVNYKDGLCFAGQRGLVKSYPHIPGIDFAGSAGGRRRGACENLLSGSRQTA